MSATIARLPIDPDLERTMVEMTGVAVRLRQLEEQLVIHGADRHYAQYGHTIVQRDDALRAIAGRAERLGLRPGSLRLFIEEHERIRRQQGRRPSLAQLQRAVITALDVRKRDLVTRNAEEAIAAFRARHAETAVADAQDATRYMDACRG